MRKITGEEMERIALNFNRKNLTLPENSKVTINYSLNENLPDTLYLKFRDVSVTIYSTEDYAEAMRKSQTISNRIHQFRQSDTRLRHNYSKVFRD